MTFARALNEYNWYQLANVEELAKPTPSRCFAAVTANVIIRRYEQAKTLLNHFEKDLQKIQAVAGLRLLLQSQSENEFAESLHAALVEYGRCQREPYLEAELAFFLGLALMQMGSYELAAHFFKDSNRHLSETDLSTLLWRGDFNLLLCHLRLHRHGEARPKADDLIARYDQLPQEAKWSLARLLAWLHFYIDDFNKGSACLQSTVQAIQGRVPQDPRLGYLINQCLYVQARHLDTQGLQIALQENQKFLSGQDRLISEQWSKTLGFESASFEQAKLLMDSWLAIEDVFYRLQLAEILLRVIIGQKKDALAARVYLYLERTFLRFKYIIPPADLREFGLIAFYRSGRHILFNRLYASYKTEAPPWRRKKLQTRIRQLDQEAKQTQVHLHLPSKSITMAGHSISFTRRQKSLELIQLALRHKGGIPAPRLAHQLFPEFRSQPEEQLARLKALISRTNQFLKRRLLLLINDRVLGAPEFVARVQDLRPSVRDRRNKIMEFADSVRHFSIRDLSNYSTESRRTLQAELNYLVKAGRLVRLGKGRGAMYRRP